MAEIFDESVDVGCADERGLLQFVLFLEPFGLGLVLEELIQLLDVGLDTRGEVNESFLEGRPIPSTEIRTRCNQLLP